MTRYKPIHLFIVGFLCGSMVAGVGFWQWQHFNTPVLVENSLVSPPALFEISKSEKEESLSEDIVIHVAGAVKNPGLLTVLASARLGEAIEEAGGALEEANLDQLNLAIVLEDGARYYIPSFKEQQEQVAIEKATNPIQNGKLDLNLAQLTDLIELPQIGESRAKAILEYRNQQGRFHSIDDIMKVPGIGEGIYAIIRDQITVR